MKREIEILLLVDDDGKAINCHVVGTRIELYSKEKAMADLEEHRRDTIGEGSSRDATIITLEPNMYGLDKLVSICNLADEADCKDDTLNSLIMFIYNAAVKKP